MHCAGNAQMQGGYDACAVPVGNLDSITGKRLAHLDTTDNAARQAAAREALREKVFPAGTPRLPRNASGEKYLSSALPAE